MTRIPRIGSEFKALVSVMDQPSALASRDFATLTENLDVRQLKELEFFGYGQLFGAIRKYIPYYHEPEHPAFQKLIADNVKENDDMLADANEAVLDTLQPAFRDGFATSNPGIVQTTALLHTELENRHLPDAEQQRVSMHAEPAQAGLQGHIRETTFGAAVQVVNNYFVTRGLDITTIESVEFAGAVQSLRTLLAMKQVGELIHKHADIDLKSFNMLSASGRLCSWLRFSDDKITIDEGYEPPQNYSIELSKTRDFSTIPVGCPARYVNRAIDWAPRALLTACLAVAET